MVCTGLLIEGASRVVELWDTGAIVVPRLKLLRGMCVGSYQIRAQTLVFGTGKQILYH